MTQYLDSKRESSIQRSGRLNVVDLAGSERLSASQVEGSHLREAASINQSLFALARCIKALSQAQQMQEKHERVLQHEKSGWISPPPADSSCERNEPLQRS